MSLHPRRLTTFHALYLSCTILVLTLSGCLARRHSRRRLPFGLVYRGGGVDEDIASPYDAARVEFQAYVASNAEECRSTVQEQLRRVEEDVADMLQQQRSLSTRKTAATGGALLDPDEERTESFNTVDDSIEISEKQEPTSSTEAEKEECGEREQQHTSRSNANDAVLSSFTAVQNSNYDPAASELLLDPIEPSTADGQWTASIATGGLASEGREACDETDIIASPGTPSEEIIEQNDEAAVKQVVTGEHLRDSTPDDTARNSNDEFYDAVESPMEEATTTHRIGAFPLPPIAEMIAGDRFYDADLIPSTTPDPSMETDTTPNIASPESSNTISTIPLPPIAEEETSNNATLTPITTGNDHQAEIGNDDFQDALESLSPEESSSTVRSVPLPPSYEAEPETKETRNEVVVGVSSASATSSLPETDHDQFFDAAQTSWSSDLSDASMQQIPDNTRDDEFFDASSSDHSSASPIITNLSGDEFFDADEVMPSLGSDALQPGENPADEHFVGAPDRHDASEILGDTQRPQDDVPEISRNTISGAQERTDDSLGVEIEMSTFRSTRNTNATNVGGSSAIKKSSSKPEDYLDTFYDASQGIDFVVGDTDEEDEAVVGRLETAIKTNSVEPKSNKKRKRKKPAKSSTKKTKRRKGNKEHVTLRKKNATLSVDKKAEEPRAKQSSSREHASTSESVSATVQSHAPAQKARRKEARKKDFTAPMPPQSRRPTTGKNLTADEIATSKSSHNGKLPEVPHLENNSTHKKKKPTSGKKRRLSVLKSGVGPEPTGSIGKDAFKNDVQREATRKKKKMENNPTHKRKKPTSGKKRRSSILKSGVGPEPTGSIGKDAFKNDLQREATRKKKMENNPTHKKKKPTSGNKRRSSILKSGVGPEPTDSIGKDAFKNDLQREVTRKKKKRKSAALVDRSPTTTEKPRSILKTSPSLLVAAKQTKPSKRIKRRRKKVSFIEAAEEVREEASKEIETTKSNFDLGRVAISMLLTVRFFLSAAFLLWIATSLARLLIFLGVLEQ